MRHRARAGAAWALFAALSACGPGETLHAWSFDARRGAAVVTVSAPSGVRDDHPLCFAAVRDGDGTRLRLSERLPSKKPLELNPGVVALELQRCALTCGGPLEHPRLVLDARPGHRYRIWVSSVTHHASGDDVTLAIVDTGSGETVTEAHGRECVRPATR